MGTAADEAHGSELLLDLPVSRESIACFFGG